VHAVQGGHSRALRVDTPAGKPLLDLGGKPMVVRVAERALLSGADEVLVASDHRGSAGAAERHGLRALLTRYRTRSGTDRLAEVVELSGWSDDTIGGQRAGRRTVD
jgi:3-deoxy-manno-octulosonate cytidylyltransferase (CMP-KDO synthetase)